MNKSILVAAAILTLGTASPAFASLNTDLASAAAGGDFNAVMTAIQLGANPNARDRAGRTPLMWAARMGHPRAAAYLITHGAVLNVTDGDGYTPLMWAARMGHFETVALLVDAGANPLVRDWQGHDALTLAHLARDWRSEDMIYRYLHGQSVGEAPVPKRANPVLGGGAVVEHTPVAVKPVPVPVAAVHTAVAPAGLAEPNLLVKAMAAKKMLDAGKDATGIMDQFVKATASNPMMLADPDAMLGKQVVELYANFAKTQSLVGVRQDLTKIQSSLGGRANSRFAKNITDLDAILKEAGL